MISFPNAKINVGLNILSRRNDGYHEIASVMVPIGWSDILEIVKTNHAESRLFISGNQLACDPKNNLVMKAFDIFRERYGIGNVDIFLHKIIPDGAGLGGGSSDAAFTLITLNNLFEIGLDKVALSDMAAQLGSDCPFFVYNQPMAASSTGTDLEPIKLSSFDGYLLVVKPTGSVSTKEAYSMVKPTIPIKTCVDLLSKQQIRLHDWEKFGVVNDFEASVFSLLSELKEIKSELKKNGAIYSSMSGSGSAIYGIFDNAKLAENAQCKFKQYKTYLGPITF